MYADASSGDPTWTTSTPAGQTTATTTTCYVTGLDGNTLASSSTGAATTINIVDLHGDVIQASPVTAAGGAGGSPTVTDEFGNTLTGTLNSYTWVGAKAKVTDTSSGLVLMGARVYNSVTGTFLQRDPVYGGNATTYGYPLDPILGYDLNGMFCWHCWLHRAATAAGIAAFGACVFMTGGVCMAVTVGALALSAAYHIHAAYTHRERVGQAFGNFMLDAVTSIPLIKPLRYLRLADAPGLIKNVGPILGLRGAGQGVRLAKEWVTLREAFKYAPIRSAARLAYNLAGVVNTVFSPFRFH